MAKQLKRVLENINSDYGDRTIINLGDKDSLQIEKVSTGISQLDEILGGGFPLGRMVEIFGNESTGKTTLALKLTAEAQKQGNVAYIDLEHCLDVEWAKKLGVNVDNLTFCQPSYAEMALDIIERLIISERYKVIILDSVAALVPKVELEGEAGDTHIGLQARLMSQAMRRLCAALAKSQCCLVFINQIRMKIGVWGNPETTTGGRALKFYAAIRINLTKIKTVIKGKTAIGFTIRAKTVKNKIAAPFQNCEFTIFFNGRVE